LNETVALVVATLRARSSTETWSVSRKR